MALIVTNFGKKDRKNTKYTYVGYVVSVHCLHWVVVNMYNTANKLNRCVAG